MLMKKLFAFIIIVFTLCFGFSFNVYGAENSDLSSESEEIIQFKDEISDGLEQITDDDVNDVLKDNDISLKDPASVSNISFGTVIDKLLSYFTDSLKKPIIMLGKILAIILLCAIAQNIAISGSSLTKTFNTMGILATITVMYETVSVTIETVQQALTRLSEFMISYVPIFSSVTAVGGSVSASGSYYAMTLIACEIIGLVGNNIIMPFLSIVMAISLVSAINPNLQFSGAAESIKKACQWILGGVTTLFVGMLSIQGIAGSASDSLITRTAKFAASSFIPIIGGAVSEAYSTLYGSIGVIRTGVGTIGIIAILIMVLKPIIAIIAAKFSISLAQIISGIFGQKESCEFLKSTNAVLSIGLSVVICFSLIFIISTAVLMLMAMNLNWQMTVYNWQLYTQKNYRG